MTSSRNRRRPTASWNCSDTSRRECGWFGDQTKRAPTTTGSPDGSLDVAAVRNDFADGYTIVMDGIDQYVRTIGTLARSLEVDLNFPTQLNAYVTPPHSSGLVPHYDDHDVLVLQIQGSKSWHLYVGADRPAREIQRDTEKAVALETLPAPTDVLLKAGDVLYVPRGRVHAAQTHAEPSVHLTVGIHAPTVLMLAIGALHSQSFRDDRLNARLPPRHLDDRDLEATVRDLVREAIAEVDDSRALEDGLGLLADVLVRRGTCPPVGKITSANAIDGQTWVVKHPTAVCTRQDHRRRCDIAICQPVDQRRRRPPRRDAIRCGVASSPFVSRSCPDWAPTSRQSSLGP